MPARTVTISFIGRGPVAWAVEIVDTRQTAASEELLTDLEWDDSAVLEWDGGDTWDAVLGSTLTLKAISPTDRALAHLWTVQPGDVTCRVTRDGVLWWAGTLDPEQYSEPWETARGYSVELTFCDLGALKRLKWDGGGASRTIRGHMSQALQRIGLGDLPLDCSMVSTSKLTTDTAADAALVDVLGVWGSDFTDEDGEPLALHDVLEGLLQPLGLRLRQWAGKLWLQDLAGQLAATAPQTIRWTSDSQTFSAGKVLNEFAVEFSPYADSQAYDGGDFDQDSILPDASGRQWVQYETYTLGTTGKQDQSAEWYGAPAFDLRTARQEVADPDGLLPFTVHDPGHVCRSVKRYGGQDDVWLDVFHMGGQYPRVDDRIGTGPFYWTDATAAPLMTTDPVPLASLHSSDAALSLCVSVEMLLDARYNPWEQDGNENNEGYTKKAAEGWNFVCAPARLELLAPDEDAVLKHYSNSQLVESEHYRPLTASETPRWEDGPDTGWNFLLMWYDVSDRKKGTGVGGGFKASRQAIGWGYTGALPASWSKRGGGEEVPVPDAAGRLRLTLGLGVRINEYEGIKQPLSSEKYSWARWWGYRKPSITVIDADWQPAEPEDLSVTGVINPAAADSASVSTICGSAPSLRAMPTAKGYYRTTGGQAVEVVTRGAHTDRPERLLIGTVLAQHADRHAVLTGECSMDGYERPGTFADPAMPGAIFRRTSERWDLREGWGECAHEQLMPEQYETLDIKTKNKN